MSRGMVDDETREQTRETRRARAARVSFSVPTEVNTSGMPGYKSYLRVVGIILFPRPVSKHVRSAGIVPVSTGTQLRSWNLEVVTALLAR